MLVLMILLDQLFSTLPTQASRYQMMRAASNRRVHRPAVAVVRSPADAPCATAIVDERIVVATLAAVYGVPYYLIKRRSRPLRARLAPDGRPLIRH